PDKMGRADTSRASREAQAAAATADLENLRLIYQRTQDLSRQGVVSPQELDQARTAAASAQAKLDALKKQVEAQRAAVAMARANAEQVQVRRSQVQANEHMQAAASAQRA